MQVSSRNFDEEPSDVDTAQVQQHLEDEQSVTEPLENPEELRPFDPEALLAASTLTARLQVKHTVLSCNSLLCRLN